MLKKFYQFTEKVINVGVCSVRVRSVLVPMLIDPTINDLSISERQSRIFRTIYFFKLKSRLLENRKHLGSYGFCTGFVSLKRDNENKMIITTLIGLRSNITF